MICMLHNAVSIIVFDFLRLFHVSLTSNLDLPSDGHDALIQ